MMLIDIQEPGAGADQPVHKPIAVGIDLGTTNSLVAVADDKGGRVIPDARGNSSLPSVVHYAAQGDVSVGDEALNQPKSIRSVKRLMGRGLGDIAKVAEHFPWPVYAAGDALDDAQDNGIENGMVTLEVHGEEVSPVEVSSEILKILRTQAEGELGEGVHQAVITVPAHFDDAARNATKDAAHLAGLEVLRLINEPTAAALAYGLENGAEGLYAVYDLGGGTFDVSLLKMEKGVFQVLATGGDAGLGGDDFDQALVKDIIARYMSDKEPTADDVVQLLQSARRVKEALSANEEVTDHIEVSDGKIVSVDYSREQYESLIIGLVHKTTDIFNNVLKDVKLEPRDILGVVMVGGSTRTPLVLEKVKELIGQDPLTNLDPDQVVALGAAMQARALTHGSDTLLLDVTPLSLGIETMGNLVEVVIPRNTAIPASVSQKFTTYKDGQTGLLIHVVQGERELVNLCRSLARFELKGIPLMVAGAAVVEVNFVIDADGLLTVSAREETTGIEQKVQVKPSYGLPPEKIEKMLRESMEFAREDITARLLAESKLDANRLLLSIESALTSDSDLLTTAQKTEMDQKIKQLRSAVSGGDRDQIDYLAQELDAASAPFAEVRLNQAIGSFLQGQEMQAVEKDIIQKNSA